MNLMSYEASSIAAARVTIALESEAEAHATAVTEQKGLTCLVPACLPDFGALPFARNRQRRFWAVLDDVSMIPAPLPSTALSRRKERTSPQADCCCTEAICRIYVSGRLLRGRLMFTQLHSITCLIFASAWLQRAPLTSNAASSRPTVDQHAFAAFL